VSIDYFNRAYPCQYEPYKETGYSKAEVKQEFSSIVDEHKDAVGKWAEQKVREKRYSAYLNLKEEFQAELESLEINCEACGNEYEVRVKKNGDDFNDFGIVCCLFCGHQIKLF